MRPSKRWRVWALAVASSSAAVLASPVHEAYAQGDVAGRDAQARFEEGLQRVKAGDYEGARLSFTQAYAVLHRPSILWNLALAEEKTSHWVDALTHFKSVARDSSAATADRDVARRHAEALAARTGHVDVQAPSGASLKVDGVPTGLVAPLSEPLDVSVGHHAIEAALSQGPKIIEVDALAGQIAHVSFFLAPGHDGAGASSSSSASAASGSAAPGSASPSSPPSPTTTPNAPPPPPEPASAPPRPPDSPPPSKPASDTGRIVTTAALGGAAIAAASVAIYLGVKSHDDENTANSLRASGPSSACSGSIISSECGRLSRAVDDQNREAIASDVLYAVAGVLAVSTVLPWVLWPKPVAAPGSGVSSSGARAAGAASAAGESPPAVSDVWIAPAVGAGTLGIGAGGSF